MKKIQKYLIPVIVFLILCTPLFSLAQTQGNLVPCGRNSGPAAVPCKFEHVLILINNLVKFILVYLAIPIAALMFFYAGALMIIHGGNEHSRTEAKSIFWNTVIGIIFVAGAWIIVHTVLNILGYNGEAYGLE